MIVLEQPGGAGYLLFPVIGITWIGDEIAKEILEIIDAPYLLRHLDGAPANGNEEAHLLDPEDD